MSFFKQRPVIILFLILALASFFRLWQIDSVPPGLYPDEAINGNDALTTLTTGQFKVFYPENNGREGLFIWLIAFSFKLLGPSSWSLRVVSAILGILTVLSLYLLAKELLDKKIALLSSFFLAVSFWHTNFSRIGFRAILVPLLISFAFYFLFRGFRTKNFLNYLWAGIFLGFGFYSYLAFRMVVLILGIVVLFKMLRYWQEKKPEHFSWSWLWHKAYLRDGWWKVDCFCIVTILMVLPLGYYFLNHPQDFISRTSGISVFSASAPLKAFISSTFQTLTMFNFTGDSNWRHNLAGSPMLSWSTGLLFILGLILIILALIRNKEKMVPLFLISWFLIMLLPATLTTEGLPHALRTVGVIPVLYIFAAIGLVWLVKQLNQKKIKGSRYIAVAFLITSLMQPAVSNFNKYFFQWAQNPNVAGAFRQDLVDLTNLLTTLPDKINKYIVVNEPGVPVPYPDGLSMPAQTIIFQSRIQNSEIKYLPPNQDVLAEINNLPTIVVMLKPDQNILEEFKKIFPTGQIKQINQFTAYEVR